jgi:hypothetical protein
MTMTYRGINYEPTNAHVDVKEEVIGRYRGAVVTRRFNSQLHEQHPQGMKYRGAIVR